MTRQDNDFLRTQFHQMRFSSEASRLSKRDAEYLISNPSKYAQRDPDNPLLSCPTGVAVNAFDTVSAEAYRIFDSYLAAWGAKNDVDTLYKILLSIRIRSERMSEAAARIKALEYAIWDAQYRFEELTLKFVEASSSNRFAIRTPEFEKWRMKLRKEIGRFFFDNRKRRGINTHQESVRIRVESDLSQLNAYLFLRPLHPEFARKDVVDFIVRDGRARLRKYVLERRSDLHLYEQSMNNSLESACDFALRAANFTSLVNAALAD
ncbi:hypothetical protein [Mesorhizobium sp. Cs1299R1N3]|uniref:hypothetical protein n=1 Tax=Mesorhizobium sp. Cs1299R1N3 TaxID=3015173 RepID=UPI00301BE921